MVKLGFLGSGNMAGALATAASKSGRAELYMSNRTKSKAEALAAKLGGKAMDNLSVAEIADYIFIGVKPQFTEALLKEIRPVLDKRKDRFVLVSMVAGWDIDRIQALAGPYPVIRIMPNTPALVGEGMTLYTPSAELTEDEMADFLDFMAPSGRFSRLPEHLIAPACGITGCGPAFADLFIEALADGAVACGVPRAQALEFAGQMLLGSAKLSLESGKHPGALKDEVCSPGGTTIEGVIALEKSGFRAAVIGAVRATVEKTAKL